MSNTIVQPFRYPYRVSYIPKGGRKSRRADLAGQDCLALQRIDMSEAKTAFRVHNRFDFEGSSVPNPFDIVCHGDALWWPVVNDTGPVSVSNFLKGLEDGTAEYLKFVYQRVPRSLTGLPTSIHDLKAREIIDNPQDEVLAQSHKGAAHILLCGDCVFRKGGEPVYIGRRLNDEPIPQYHCIIVVDPLCRLELPVWSLGYCPRRPFENCAYFGDVFSADELDDARAFAAEKTMTATSTIEIVNNFPVRIDPISVQLETCVRHLEDLMDRTSLSNEFEYPFLAHIASHFTHLVEQETISAKEATKAISSLLTLRDPDQSPRTLNLEYAHHEALLAINLVNAHCSRRGVVSPFRLDADEEAALSDLST